MTETGSVENSKDFQQAASEQEVLLPQSAKELDDFVAGIIKDYELPEGDDTYEAIATMILHLPGTRAHAPRAYFANSVRKQIANKYAYEKCGEFVKARESKAREEKAKAQAENGPDQVGTDQFQQQAMTPPRNPPIQVKAPKPWYKIF